MIAISLAFSSGSLVVVLGFWWQQGFGRALKPKEKAHGEEWIKLTPDSVRAAKMGLFSFLPLLLLVLPFFKETASI